MNILVAGLGAIGSIYAVKFKNSGADLKILTDENRHHRYQKDGLIFNGKKYDFDYILPDENDYHADLIIIAVKSYDLEDIIENISSFVDEKTKIISLLNGISSEDILRQKFSKACVLDSYYVGHASMKKGNTVTYDGIGKIVFSGDKEIEKLFEDSNIEHEVPSDIKSSMWQKFIINIGVNQTTAVFNEPYSCFGREEARDLANKLMQEGVNIAEKIGIKGSEKFINNAFKLIDDMPLECKTSMMQDIEKGKKTEVDIFAGEVCKLGKKYGIETPENERVFRIIKSTENKVD